ncbi:hypothetical protein [Crateriforma spongiae]|uniref:hypothetical protein n=1 Tax=Crateriforma spongiae TaxID=2724528 RepID=UPI0039AEFD01
MELTATPVPERRRVTSTAIESLLDLAAIVILCLGVAASITVLAWVGIVGLGMACWLILGSFLNWLVFRALAEVIRLLKRSVDLDYAGRISGSYVDTVMTCSNCGAILRSDVCCDSCGARLTKVDPKD